MGGGCAWFASVVWWVSDTRVTMRSVETLRLYLQRLIQPEIIFVYLVNYMEIVGMLGGT